MVAMLKLEEIDFDFESLAEGQDSTMLEMSRAR